MKKTFKLLFLIPMAFSYHLSMAQNTIQPIEPPNQENIRQSTERMVLVRLYEAEHRLREFNQIFLDNIPSEQEENLRRVKAQINYLEAVLNARTNSYAIMQKGLDVLEKYYKLLNLINKRNESLSLN